MRWKWKATAGGGVDQWGGDCRLPLPDWAMTPTQRLPTLPSLDDEFLLRDVPAVQIGQW